jgi:hypothetical protein
MSQFQETNHDRIKEISEDILKSMLVRSYPVVDATHFFKKYTINGEPDHQFLHALVMMTKGGILRIDKKGTPLSVTFVLMENGTAKMHHMIDSDWNSSTFGQMFNDPYEGPKKRVHCFKHIMPDEKTDVDCEKCKLENNSMICMNHGNVLSRCEKCIKLSAEIKKGLSEGDAENIINAILKEYKKQYWSFSN